MFIRTVKEFPGILKLEDPKPLSHIQAVVPYSETVKSHLYLFRFILLLFSVRFCLLGDLTLALLLRIYDAPCSNLGLEIGNPD
jgi:hypothetical protein